MPIPDLPPNQPRIEIRVPRDARHSKREVTNLIASNPVSSQHEVEINRRHYKFMIPSNWAKYDDSYTANMSGDELPGKINVQFVAPAKDGTIISFSFRGRSVRQEDATLFHSLLQSHIAQAKSEELQQAQIKKLAFFFAPVVGDNQYYNESGHKFHRFKMTSCKTVSLNNNAPALSVEGEFTNNPGDKTAPDAYWHVLYLDGSGDGLNVHEIQFQAPTKEAFEKAKPAFDQVLKTLTW
jgi:hypothetical protein